MVDKDKDILNGTCFLRGLYIKLDGVKENVIRKNYSHSKKQERWKE